jgi:hypothetical protein
VTVQVFESAQAGFCAVGVGKIAFTQERAYAASMAIPIRSRGQVLRTRKAEHVATAREMLHVRNICRGAPLPTLQVLSGMRAKV